MRGFTVSERLDCKWVYNLLIITHFCISSCFNRVIQTSLSVIISNFRDSVMISCTLGQVKPAKISGQGHCPWTQRGGCAHRQIPAVLPWPCCEPPQWLELCRPRDRTLAKLTERICYLCYREENPFWKVS